MLQITNLTKSFGTRVLFSEASLVVNAGERIGLIGRNGYGKSTLLRLISGKEAPDSGQIALEKGARIGVLEQYFQFQGASTLLEAESALPLIDGAYRETYKAEQVLEGLGFDETLRNRPPHELSGGFQIRLNLAKLLLSEPDILLLDEPTNYLDIISLRWLEEFLLAWQGSAITVSHDRSFIDKVSTHIALIYRQTIRKGKGTTEQLYSRIQEEEAIHERTRQNQLKEREKQEEFIRKYRSKARQASRVQSRVKRLEKMEMLEELEGEEQLSFSFSYAPFTPKWILQVKDVEFGYETPLFTGLNFSLGAKDRLAIIGANGKGKSTLLSLLFGAIKPWSGSADIHTQASVGYLGQSNIERLHPEKTVEQLILEVEANNNRTRARTIAGCMLFSGEAAEKEAKVLSGGEKTRVHLGRIIARPTNLLFLDEPTNHLDFYASQALLHALEEYPGAMVIVSHDEEFLSKVASRLIVFQNEEATLFEGGYENFLYRGGWEGELLATGGAKNHTPSDSRENSHDPSLSKKENRKVRAEQARQRKEKLAPLQKAVTKIEAGIMEQEQALKKEEAELIEITTHGFSDEAAKLARSISARKKAIDELFAQFEIAEAELQSLEKELSEASSTPA